MKSDPVDAAIEALEKKPNESELREALGECLAMLRGIRKCIGTLGEEADSACEKAQKVYERAGGI